MNDAIYGLHIYLELVTPEFQPNMIYQFPDNTGQYLPMVS